MNVVVTPSTGAAWATAWEQFEGIRKGLISLSLTNYDATTVPQIAAGSWIEAAGSIYKRTTAESISGTPSANAINFITMVPSGTGASAILTPTWSATPPTWSDAYQGWFSGTTRYAGGCYYDGTNYVLKWVYTNQHSGPVTRYTSPAFVSYITDATAEYTQYGGYIVHNDTGTTDEAFMILQFPQFGIITELYSYCSGYVDSSATISLKRSALTSQTITTLASTSHSGTGAQTDTTITTPLIDRENYIYFIEMVGNTNTTLNISGVRVKYSEIVRC